EGQKEIQEVGRKYGVRLMGPNIYGFYYTWSNLCATFCTAYDVKGHAALSSQSGGIGMAIIGFSRSAKMGVSAIVGLGNKSDIDEDDLLTFFEQDENTHIIAQHCEDLKDGRAFAEVAKRVSKKKPIVMLKAGRTSMGARAASWHTIVTPPMVFATKMVEVVEEMRAKGIRKPIVVSLAGDVQVEEAAEHLFAHGIPAYPYTTETPVAVLAAKYKWARGAGLI